MRVDHTYLIGYLIFLLSTSSLIAKEVGTYYCDLGDNENTVVIGLNIDKSYYLKINCTIIENTFSFPISAGNYTSCNELLTLHDNYSGFVLSFKIKEDSLLDTGNNTFKWLKNIKLIKSGDYYDSEEDILADGNMDQLRQLNNITNPGNNILRFGQYEAGNDYRFILILKETNQYVFKFRNLILSEGEFRTNGNEVKLYDASLEHDFYLFVSKNELENVFFPGLRLWKLRMK